MGQLIAEFCPDCCSGGATEKDELNIDNYTVKRKSISKDSQLFYDQRAAGKYHRVVIVD